MGKLSDVHSPIKALIMGPSGSGKTGALWSLAAAGFNLKIYDADRGTGVLASALKNNPEALARVEVNTFTNAIKFNAKGFAIPDGSPKAWPDLLAALNKWPDDPEKGIQDWGPDTVVIIDSLSLCGRHALLKAQHDDNNKTGKQPEIQHYGTAMAQLEAMIGALYSDYVNCHVLVLTHIAYIQDDLGISTGLPMALGEKLSPILPRYFNTMLVVKTTGNDRMLATQPTMMVKTKVENFSSVKAEYPLVKDNKSQPGLAQFFSDCGWPSLTGDQK